jgi:hypothetical protein
MAINKMNERTNLWSRQWTFDGGHSFSLVLLPKILLILSRVDFFHTAAVIPNNSCIQPALPVSIE